MSVADRLHSAAIHLLRRVRKQDIATGEGPPAFPPFRCWCSVAKTLGELAAAEQVKPPTMSRMVAGLVRSRLVAITADPHEDVVICIYGTDKCSRLLQKGRQLRVSYLA